MIFDTHSHLFDEAFKDDFNECIVRAKQNNVNKIMLVGFTIENNKKALAYANEYPGFFYNSAGIHPSEYNEDYENDLSLLREFIQNNKVYAIGECGIDYHYRTDDKDIQKYLFEEQIKLSIEYDLPIIVHMRDATQECFDILKKYKGKVKGIMHCYTGSLEMANEFIKLGLYISLGGPVTFKNANEAKRVACNIDLSKLLVETDCPYLTPVPFRGKRNESSYILYTVEEIAKLRNMPRSEIEEITYSNASSLFKIEQ